VYSLKPAFSAVSIPFWLLSIRSELRFLENGVFGNYDLLGIGRRTELADNPDFAGDGRIPSEMKRTY
jgi:hypothetical protein